jgi:hypothetical protein
MVRPQGQAKTHPEGNIGWLSGLLMPIRCEITKLISPQKVEVSTNRGSLHQSRLIRWPAVNRLPPDFKLDSSPDINNRE